MKKFFRDLLNSEAHKNAYVWVSVFGAHAALAAIAFSSVMAITKDADFSARICIAAYMIFELTQITLKSSIALLFDSILDLCAWAMMIGLVYSLSLGNFVAAAMFGYAELVVMLVGVKKRA